MSFRKVLLNKKENSDYSKIRVSSNGAFYMKSKDIFNDKVESLALISKLSKVLDNYKENQKKSVVSSEVQNQVNA